MIKLKKDYEQRAIVFMDILGFKNLVKMSESNSEYRNTLFNIMKYFKFIEKNNYEGVLRGDEIGKEVTVFSDSIVISYDINLPGQVFYILLSIIHIQLELTKYRVFLRGGITIGDVYHKGNIVFGPGMVCAYELESQYAQFPRIIVDKKAIEYAYTHPAPQNGSEQELEYVLSLLKEDTDKKIYTDFLSQDEELDYPIYIKQILSNVRETIQDTLKSLDECINDKNNNSRDIKNKLGVKDKYIWLKKYYNYVAEKYNYPLIN